MDARSYKQMIEQENERFRKKLEALFTDRQDQDDFYSGIVQALVIREQVYLEIGMKAGAKLIFQMLSEQDKYLF